MSVKERKGHWEIDRKWPDGSRYRRYVQSDALGLEIDRKIQASITMGQTAWRDYRRELCGGERGIGFRALAKKYLKEYVASMNKSTQNKAGRINALLPHFGGMPIAEISPRHVTAYVGKRKAAGLKAATINRDVTVLRHMIGWAVTQEDLPREKAAWLLDVRNLRESPEERPRATDEMLDAIFARLDARVVPLFTFIRETGCRREECLSLRRHQIDWARAEVTFSGNTKSGKPRTVPLTEEAQLAIKAMPKTGRTEYVFYHPTNLTRWDECRKPWLAARAKAAEELERPELGRIWIKDMRPAFAIKLAEAGTPMHFIQQMLGHSSVNVTARFYARFSPESASEAVRKQLRVIRGGKSGKKVETA